MRDSASGDLILKLVNGDDSRKTVRIELQGERRLPRRAQVTVLAGDPDHVNDYAGKRLLELKTSTFPIAGSFEYSAPAHSLSILRLPRKRR